MGKKDCKRNLDTSWREDEQGTPWDRCILVELIKVAWLHISSLNKTDELCLSYQWLKINLEKVDLHVRGGRSELFSGHISIAISNQIFSIVLQTKKHMLTSRGPPMSRFWWSLWRRLILCKKIRGILIRLLRHESGHLLKIFFFNKNIFSNIRHIQTHSFSACFALIPLHCLHVVKIKKYIIIYVNWPNGPHTDWAHKCLQDVLLPGPHPDESHICLK